jgi:uncharacterized protein involved in exopolysaccharide biosynthesis
MRRPAVVVLAIVAIFVGIAAAYAFLAPDRYEARADLLVTPAQGNDELAGLGLLADTQADAAVTAAALVETPAVARAVATRLRMTESEARGAVDAHRVDGSNVVRIVGNSSDPARAAQIANAFADETVSALSARFQSELQFRIKRLTDQLQGMPIATPQGIALRTRIDELRARQGSPDPTVRVVSTAVAPTERAWPKPWLIIVAAALAGLVVGLLVAVLRARRKRPPPVTTDAQLSALEQRLDKRLDKLAQVVGRAVDTVDEAEHERIAAREHALEERVAKVTSSERELARRAAEVERLVHDAEADEAERERVAERERELEERLAAVTAQEEELARLAAELDAKAQAPPPRPPPELEPEPPPAPAQPEPVPTADGAYRLERLESIVAAREADFPERASEWHAYLFFLRDHAASDGTIPAHFEYLIEEVFAEVLE